MNGIMTVPIVYALGNLPPAERSELELLLGSKSSGRETHQRMRDLITKSGALRHALIAAEQQRLEALVGYETLSGNTGDRNMLRYFCAAARLAEIA